jgi:hypothetical protein
MKKSLLIGIATMAFACNSQSDNNAMNDTIIPKKTGESPTRCYAYLTDKDTVRLQLAMDGKSATGDLSYRLYEKDNATGTIRGGMHGDTLVADYTFAAEGTESVREVRFLKHNDILVEGIGDMEEIDGKMVYKNPESIRYMGGLVLKKVDCDK